ncbi:hypothetical protein ACFSJU_09350 [Paradesertivirga mongoliensis]|uniref:Uncharacterized protein n=1 Tax=Paradesertivirga mongoliensis TaxID=2100740 RepID=A0ABW4ZLL9_9SPHI|nr:hypothetical protein [Pedobacter mongoliensis]
MDRIDGMKMGVIPGLIAVHIIFGLAFIKSKWLYKTVSIIILATMVYGFVWLSMSNRLIQTGFGNYGYWDLALTNFLVGLIAWEVFYQFDHRLKKNWL